jgi:hypothetical protein
MKEWRCYGRESVENEKGNIEENESEIKKRTEARMS